MILLSSCELANRLFVQSIDRTLYLRYTYEIHFDYLRCSYFSIKRSNTLASRCVGKCMNPRIPSPLARKLHWKYTYCAPISRLARRRFSLCRSLARSRRVDCAVAKCVSYNAGFPTFRFQVISIQHTAGVSRCIDVSLWYVKSTASESARGQRGRIASRACQPPAE